MHGNTIEMKLMDGDEKAQGKRTNKEKGEKEKHDSSLWVTNTVVYIESYVVQQTNRVISHCLHVSISVCAKTIALLAYAVAWQ